MKKSISTYSAGPDIRIFLKGMDVSDLVRNLRINSSRYATHTITLEFNGVGFIDEDGAIHIGEIPTREFLAEMVKLRLKRD